MAIPHVAGRPAPVARLKPYAVTIFAEMSALASRLGAVNLGQGFPDEDGPAAMLKTAENAIAEGVNQYPPGPGIPALRQAIAAQRQRHYGITYDPDTEVLVTVGAKSTWTHCVPPSRRAPGR
jgi:N-succinyldiaminopimelate aminotransferase